MTTRLTLDSVPFAGRTGRGVRVAVVDSGVAAGHPHVGAVIGGVSLVDDAHDAADYRDRIGHGTAVAGAIREKAPDAELLAVRIFDRELRATGETLARAIRWAADEGAQLINLSLGTPNEDRRSLLNDALKYASGQETIVVAAARHDAAPMYPGALEGSVGVLWDANCARDEIIILDSAPRSIRVAASGFPRPIPGVPPERNVQGLSFAVANTTGFLARLVEVEDLRSWLATHGIDSGIG